MGLRITSTVMVFNSICDIDFHYFSHIFCNKSVTIPCSTCFIPNPTFNTTFTTSKIKGAKNGYNTAARPISCQAKFCKNNVKSVVLQNNRVLDLLIKLIE
jgi:hypothetical protein